MKIFKKSESKLKLIVARHAESDFNVKDRIQGHLDSKLTRKGIGQAEALAKELKSCRIRKIYSSDLGRAFTTSSIVAKKIKKPIIKDKGLREIYLGRWEGMTPEEVDKHYNRGFKQWRKSPSSMVIPDGEIMDNFRARVRRSVSRIVRKERKGTILILTHGGAMASLVSDWLMADFDRVLLNMRIENTGLVFVDVIGKDFFVRSINGNTKNIYS